MALSASRCTKNLFRNIKDEIILDAFKSNHQQAYEKEHWRLRGYERIIRENHQNCLTKEIYIYLMTNQALPRSDGKLFCKIRVMVKASIPPSITEETVRGVL